METGGDRRPDIFAGLQLLAYSLGSDYVRVQPVLDALNIDISETEEWIYMINPGIWEDNPIEIDGEIYITLSIISYNIGGRIKQSDFYSMYLYSADFIHTDVPATLEEAYRFLDELLDPEDIEKIKNFEEEDNIFLLHLGLGMWIRNNWIYQPWCRLPQELLKLNPNIVHPDDMSHLILVGYYYYLNNMPFDYTTADMW